MAKVVAVIGALGGAGATTVTAHLAVALVAQKRRALSVDFCPDNMMRLHFGMSWLDHGGFAADLLQGKEWHGAAYRSGNGHDFVPFGQLTADAELDRLVDWLRPQPYWFKEQLATLHLPSETVILCDCPRMPAVLREQCLAAADLVLLVGAPDTVSFAIAARIADGVMQEQATPTMIVLNAFDPSRRLDRDIAVLLRTQYRHAFSPVVIHRDESLREALACKQTVFDFAPSSQAAYEFSALATWTLARLGQGPEVA